MGSIKRQDCGESIEADSTNDLIIICSLITGKQLVDITYHTAKCSPFTTNGEAAKLNLDLKTAQQTTLTT